MEYQSIHSKPEDSLILQPSWRSYFVFYVAIFIFGIGPSLNPETEINRLFGWFLSLVIVIFIILRRKTTYYQLNKTEVLRVSKFLKYSFPKSLPREQIDGLVVRRGIVHRLLGIGHLQFRSRSSGYSDLWWFGIENPFKVKKEIEQFLSEG